MGADTTARKERGDRRGQVQHRVCAAALALALVAIVVPGSATAALPKTTSDLIVPAHSIGGVSLGASARAVTKAWGKDDACEYQCLYEGTAGKSETPSRAGALLEKSASGAPKVWGAYISVGENMEGSTARPIFTTPLTKFKTSKGIGLGSTAAELKRAYPAAKKDQAGLSSYALKGPRESATIFTLAADHRIIEIAISSHPGG